ncbi:metallophosphoesterase [Melioribacteraceae bacterium 4301-Me]|uniref:metallophosphoesterase family protein n=1 Tax=Pyranulibacter aquaticus TaxID=3163344 RepID=UPI0035968448
MKSINKISFIVSILFFSFLFSIKVYAQQDKFSFIVISDVHISSDTIRDAKLKQFIGEVNNKIYGNACFIVFTGDNVSSYFADRNKPNDVSNNRSLKFISIVSKLNIPYYIALGNHDYKIDRDKDSDAPFSQHEIDTMEILWENSASLKPFYSFVYDGWKFIILNSMRGRYLNRFFDDVQMKMLKKELSDGKPAFLFFHHPIKTDHFRIWCKPKDLITEEKEPEFFSILREYKNQVKGIFVGHGHMWNDDILFNKVKVYETTTFGEKKPIAGYLIEANQNGEFFIKSFEKEDKQIHWESK